LRVLEKRLLQTDGIERVIDAPNAIDAAKALSQSSEYDFSALVKPEDYELVLSSELKKTYKSLYNLAPDKTVMDIILAKYDYHNLKTALKSKYLGKNDALLYVDYTLTPPEYIQEAVISGAKPEKLPEHLAQAIVFAEAAYLAGENPQNIDIALDTHMFGHLSEQAKLCENDFIAEYVKLLIDFYNVKLMLRAKNMDKDLKFLKNALCDGGKINPQDLISNFEKEPAALADAFHYKYFGTIMKTAVENFEKTGNFSSLEKLFDNCLIEHVKKSKYISFGPEVLLSYIFSKENEARQIRIIMTCKINNIRPEVLRERLRDNYA
jgi:V/A-type H+-transporting ATPase subunit C